MGLGNRSPVTSAWPIADSPYVCLRTQQGVSEMGQALGEASGNTEDRY